MVVLALAPAVALPSSPLGQFHSRVPPERHHPVNEWLSLGPGGKGVGRRLSTNFGGEEAG